jgi:hypothetical protein
MQGAHKDKEKTVLLKEAVVLTQEPPTDIPENNGRIQITAEEKTDEPGGIGDDSKKEHIEAIVGEAPGPECPHQEKLRWDDSKKYFREGIYSEDQPGVVEYGFKPDEEIDVNVLADNDEKKDQDSKPAHTAG